jgi:hypothetical protein
MPCSSSGWTEDADDSVEIGARGGAAGTKASGTVTAKGATVGLECEGQQCSMYEWDWILCCEPIAEMLAGAKRVFGPE